MAVIIVFGSVKVSFQRVFRIFATNLVFAREKKIVYNLYEILAYAGKAKMMMDFFVVVPIAFGFHNIHSIRCFFSGKFKNWQFFLALFRLLLICLHLVYEESVTLL